MLGQYFGPLLLGTCIGVGVCIWDVFRIAYASAYNFQPRLNSRSVGECVCTNLTMFSKKRHDVNSKFRPYYCTHGSLVHSNLYNLCLPCQKPRQGGTLHRVTPMPHRDRAAVIVDRDRAFARGAPAQHHGDEASPLLPTPQQHSRPSKPSRLIKLRRALHLRACSHGSLQ